MSYLLSSASKVPETLTVWSPSGHDAFGQPAYTAPIHIKGVWQDIDNLRTTPSSKEKETDTFLHTTEVLEVGSWIGRGEFVSLSPPTDSKEIRFKRTMRFSSNVRTTYRYSL